MRPLAILLLLAALAAEDAPGPWRTDLEAALAAARAPGAAKPLAVLVSHPSCSWCHRMIAESRDAPAVVRAGSEVVLTVLDAGERPDLAALLGVRGYPTLVLVNRAGKEVRRVSGYLPPDDLATTLRVLALSGDNQEGAASPLARRIDPTEMVRSDEGRRQLVAMLGHGPAGIRTQVRAALAGSREAKPLLWPLLTHVTLAVRCDAAAALAGDGGDMRGYDPFANHADRATAAARWQAEHEAPP